MFFSLIWIDFVNRNLVTYLTYNYSIASFDGLHKMTNQMPDSTSLDTRLWRVTVCTVSIEYVGMCSRYLRAKYRRPVAFSGLVKCR